VIKDKVISVKNADWRRFSRPVIDTILPPQSLITGDVSVTGIEGELWQALRFLDEPCCHLCGYPFYYDVGQGALCGGCSVKPAKYRFMRSAFVYDENSRRLVLDFKHGGKTTALPMFAAQMARAGRQFLPKADFIVPVPLHYRRRVKRRFNQSALLARRLAQQCGASFDPDILYRHKATAVQGGLNARKRRANVRGAFRVRESAKDRIKGAHIVLIDDVLTTGATLQACAQTLLREDVQYVDALSLARVVRPAPLPT